MSKTLEEITQKGQAAQRQALDKWLQQFDEGTKPLRAVQRLTEDDPSTLIYCRPCGAWYAHIEGNLWECPKCHSRQLMQSTGEAK